MALYISHSAHSGGQLGSGPGENSGHPGEDGGYAERAGRIWKEKKYHLVSRGRSYFQLTYS